jgi:hypothetical protein
MQSFDDVAALSKRAEALFDILGDDPTGWTGGLRQPEALQRSRPTDPEIPERIASAGCARPQIDHPILGGRLSNQDPIQPGEPLRCHLRFQAAPEFQLGPWTELLGDEGGGAGAEALADVVAADPPQRRSAAHNPARHSETLSSRTPFGRAVSFQGIWIPHSLRSALALNGPSFTHLDDCRPNRPAETGAGRRNRSSIGALPSRRAPINSSVNADALLDGHDPAR